MKISKFLISVGMLSVFYAQAALAQPSVVVESAEVPDSQATVQIGVEFNTLATLTAGQFDVVYDTSKLTADISATCPTPAVWGCTENTLGTIRFASGFFPSGSLPAFTGAIVFTLTSAQVGDVYALTVAGEIYTDASGDVLPDGTTDGEIKVVGAAYESNPPPGPIDLGSVIMNDLDPTANVVIDNIGATGTSLDGECTITTNSTVFSVDSGSPFMVPEAGPNATVIVSCDSAQAIDTYTGEMTCTHNGDNIGDAVYALSCTITAGPQAAYSSDPVAGTPIALTAANQGDPIADASVTISNSGDPGTTLTGTCAVTGTGAPPISVADGAFSIAQGGSPDTQLVSCDSSSAGSYSATLTCEHNGSNPTATYAVTCDVGPAVADVELIPAPGTLTLLAQPGGSMDFDVNFVEVDDQGVDGSLDSCSLATGTNFTITSPPAPGSVTIPAGGSFTVTVTGTDPGGVDSITDDLTCIYSDGPADNQSQTTVMYTLVMDIGGNATFVVTKDFTDDNTGDVDVTITCNTGLPLTQTHTINEVDGVGFVVESFDSGLMDCSITEDLKAGYIPSYEATGDSLNADDEPDNPGCHFFNVDGGDGNFCHITNTPAPVRVAVTKEWVAAGAGDELDFRAEVEVRSLNPIWDDLGDPGIECVLEGNLGSPSGDVEIEYCVDLEFLGPSTQTRYVTVLPDFGGTVVKLKEDLNDHSMESTNSCGGENAMVVVSPGQGSSCTFVNTVFFEGIPTLNQYGLAILALLMLGVGMVGFRRFT